MIKKSSRNIPASIHQKLLNLAHKKNEDFQRIFNRYALERFLYRLSKHHVAQQFVLKGALLFEIWQGAVYRPTRDADFLGYKDPSPEHIQKIFASVCRIRFKADGMAYNSASVTLEAIREENRYGGIRVRLNGNLGNALARLQLDIGFGDSVVPAPKAILFPTLLPFPAPKLHVYPWESVIAEKFQTIVFLGMMNSRMKDYYDLFQLCRNLSFDGKDLAKAIKATFKSRATALPKELPLGLSTEFSEDKNKQGMWSAYMARIGQSSFVIKLQEVVQLLADFLMSPTSALIAKKPFGLFWSPGGPWKKKRERDN